MQLTCYKNRINYYCRRLKDIVVLWGYRNIFTPIKVRQIRNKDKIKVLFYLTSLSAWKTELLYIRMLNHEKFHPYILILKGLYCEDNRIALKEYCVSKGYDWDEIDIETETIAQKFNPDIIVCQKPYNNEYASCLKLRNNLSSLFIYSPYALRNTVQEWSSNTELLNNCWHVYYENDILYNEYVTANRRLKRNGRVTGTPILDELAISKDTLDNPWKEKGTSKIRIIYAPHHSIDKVNLFDSGTFLIIGEKMLELAIQYSNKVVWTFKPHPLLRKKLEVYWSKEKIEKYFNAWNEIGLLEEGRYLGLFKHSDALIHDCGSFIIEYHVTGNPVFYINKEGSKVRTTFNHITQKGYKLHYQGESIDSIKSFIDNVIADIDPKRNDRLGFREKNLVSPYNKTACENIIDCIIDGSREKHMRR